MKKTLSIILLFLIILTNVSCSKKDIAEKELVVPEISSIENIKETSYKKVFILCGQSNASGVSHVEYLNDFGDEKKTELLNGYSNVHIKYCVDVTNSSDSFVDTKAGQGVVSYCFGPELGFAEVMSKKTNDDVYIIKWTRSGTCLDTEWFDSNYNRGNLYNQAITYIKNELQALSNVKVVGFMWMQGETDGVSELSKKYYLNQMKLLEYLNADLEDYISEDGLAFVDAMIAENWPNYKKINYSKLLISKTNDLYRIVDTVSFGFKNNKEPYGNVDSAHYDASSEIALGEWFAKYMIEIINSR